jgi:hypothetical protein
LLLDQRNSKGSALHPDALSYLSRRKRDIIKSPLDGELLQTLLETFMPLHESVKPGIRFVDKYLDHIEFHFPPKGQQNVLKYHDALELLDSSPDILHFITGESSHKFDRDIPVSNRTHNHGGYTLVQGGAKKKTRIQPAGRWVSREDTASWLALMSIIKLVKFIKKQGLNSVKTVNLYTSAIDAVQRLCNTSFKPAGRGLAIAFTAALEDLFDQFPHIKVNVIGVNKSWLSRPCDHMH